MVNHHHSSVKSNLQTQLELGKPERRRPVKQVNGIFWILLLNIGIFVADHLLQITKRDEAMCYVPGDPTTKPKGYDPMTEAVLLWEWDKSIAKTRYNNLTPFAISLNEVTLGLLEKLPPTDSRLRPYQRHLENGEYELANAEKLRLEQLQRQIQSTMVACVYEEGRRAHICMLTWYQNNIIHRHLASSLLMDEKDQKGECL